MFDKQKSKKIKKMLLVLFVVLLLWGASYSILTTLGADSGWWVDTNWDYCKKITIDHTKVDATLTNFPILFHNISSDFVGHTQSDGGDFVFVNSDNVTQYKHEVEYYNSDTGEIIAWVNITTLSSSVDTVVYLYYGNDGCANQEDVSNTWHDDYHLVAHLNETSTGTILDSTSLSNDGTTGNSPDLDVSGVIGSGAYFNGDIDCGLADYIDFGTSSTIVHTNRDEFAIEAWVKYEKEVVDDVWFCDWTGADSWRVVLGTYDAESSAGMHFIHRNAGVATRRYGATHLFTDWEAGTWYHYVATYDANNNFKGLYVNGELEDSTHSNVGTLYNDAGNFRIGSPPDEASYDFSFNGTIDEIRYYDVNQSASWIKASYHTQNMTTGFLTLSSEKTYGWSNTPPTITGSSENPPDEETGVEKELANYYDHFNITVADIDEVNQSINVTWRTNESGTWQDMGYNESVTCNSIFYCTNVSWIDEYSHTYYWSVNVSDDATSKGWVNATYSFTAEPAGDSPEASNPLPADEATGISKTPTNFSITIIDPNGDNMNITWRTNASGFWQNFNYTNSTASGSGSRENIFTQDFENCNLMNNWSLDETGRNTSSTGTYEISDNTAGSYQNDINAAHSGTYMAQGRDSVTAGLRRAYNRTSIDISAYSSVNISVWVTCEDTESDDYLEFIYYNVTGDNWIDIVNITGTTLGSGYPNWQTNGQWHHYEIAIPDAYKPDDLIIEYRWRTSASQERFAMDDLNVSGILPTGYTGVGDGTYNVTNTSWVDTALTKYWWSVNVTDSTTWTNHTYSFTTVSSITNPVVTTNATTDINDTSAKLWGYVSNAGGEDDSVWFEWDTAPLDEGCSGFVATGSVCKDNRSIFNKNRHIAASNQEPRWYSGDNYDYWGMGSSENMCRFGMNTEGLMCGNLDVSGTVDVDKRCYLSDDMTEVWFANCPKPADDGDHHYILGNFSTVADAANNLAQHMSWRSYMVILSAEEGVGALVTRGTDGWTNITWINDTFLGLDNSMICNGAKSTNAQTAETVAQDIIDSGTAHDQSQPNKIGWADVVQRISHSRLNGGTWEPGAGTGSYSAGGCTPTSSRSAIVGVGGNESFNGAANLVWMSVGHTHSAIYLPISTMYMTSGSDIHVNWTDGIGMHQYTKVKQDYATHGSDNTYYRNEMRNVTEYMWAAENYTFDEYDTFMDNLLGSADEAEVKSDLWAFVNESMDIAFQGYVENLTEYESSTTTSKQYPQGFGTFSQTLYGLDPGTVYFYKAYANNTGYSASGSEIKFMTLPNKPTSLSTTNGSTYINLTWTKGSGAQYTVIENHTSENWARGTGNQIYNGTGNYYNHISIDSNTQYYYQMWSYTSAESEQQYSSDNASINESTISVIELISGDVEPNSGVDSYTIFYFNVTWKDSSGESPGNNSNYLKINISMTDGLHYNQSMSWVSGNNATGALYTYSRQLTTSAHWNYTFWAYDGTVYNSSGPQSGPTVAANSAPVQSNPVPANASTNIVIPLSNFSITVSDVDGESMNIYLYRQSGGSWTLFNQTLAVNNGTYTFTNTSWVDTNGALYNWSVNVTDGFFWTNKSYHFTTIFPDILSDYIYPKNNATDICPCCDATCFGVGKFYGRVNVTVYRHDSHNSNFYIVEEFYNITNGTYCFCIDGHISGGRYHPVRYNETYYWYVNASKFGNSSLYATSSVYKFTTAVNHSYCHVG